MHIIDLIPGFINQKLVNTVLNAHDMYVCAYNE